MPHDKYVELLNRVCRVPVDPSVRPSRQSDKCFLMLFFLHEKVGLKSAQLYEEIDQWSSTFFKISTGFISRIEE